MSRPYRYCLLTLLLPFWLLGQDTTRVIKPSVGFISEREIDLGLNYRRIDTMSNKLEIFSPVFKKLVIFQDLGNIGTAAAPLLFSAGRESGFSYAYNPYGVYFISPRQTEYVNTRTPYTDITYSQGSEELIFLQLKHAQNILNRWNVGVDFHRITSMGFFLRQKTSMYHYQFHTSYYSKNKRYGLLANATWNRGVIEDNGGIESDSSFEALTGPNKKVFVNLVQSRTRYRNRSAFLKQYYRWGRQEYTYTKDNDTLYDFVPRVQLSHAFQAEEISYIFENGGDTDRILLPNQYYDTGTSTYDSSFYGKLTNTLQLDLLGNRSVRRSGSDTIYHVLSFSFRNEMINAAQIPFARFYTNHIARVSLQQMSLTERRANAGLSADYVIAGYNAGDYRADVSARFRFAPFTLEAASMVQAYRPDFALQLFRSNAFIWSNTFSQTGVTKLEAGISTNKLRHNPRLNVQLYNLQNWVYMGTDARPAQFGGSVRIIRAELGKTFQLWKFFFEHELYYQQTSNTGILRLPEFSGLIRYYFESRLFKVMRFRVGFDAFYYSALYANAYNPATRQFYLQNNVQTGNYPLIDPFFVGDIRRASFFLKYEHVNQDLIQTRMYATPHHPYSLSSFRIGVRWRFYD